MIRKLNEDMTYTLCERIQDNIEAMVKPYLDDHPETDQTQMTDGELNNRLRLIWDAIGSGLFGYVDNFPDEDKKERYVEIVEKFFDTHNMKF